MIDRATAEAVRDRCCTGKTRYPRDVARDLAARLTRGRGRGEKPTGAYQCPFCRAWHVGHVPSVRTLQDLAEAIRVLAQTDPEEPQEEREAS